MNFCLHFSTQVEDELLRLIADRDESTEDPGLSVEEEQELYERAFDTTLESYDGTVMAAGDVRIGDIIHLVDCDTRVVSYLTYPSPS